MILLDTCALLWLVSGGGKLSKTALERIDAAAIVHVSAISCFEISLKYRQGKLMLPVPPKTWFQAVVAHHDLSVISLDWEICCEATMLPAHHKDPCDRFIIATARIYDIPVLTADEHFQAYDIRVIA